MGYVYTLELKARINELSTKLNIKQILFSNFSNSMQYRNLFILWLENKITFFVALSILFPVKELD